MNLKSTLLTEAAEAAFLQFKARMNELSSIQEENTPLIPMSISPTTSGKYLVGHRGHQVVMHFLSPDEDWAEGTRLGWQGDLSFGPTHWTHVPVFPIS